MEELQMSDFSSRLNELKKNNNTSNQELADAVGISIRGLQFYLSGEKEPTLTKLVKIADFFDVSIDYLTGRE
jgi:transcriptional regulator with XRE-family HTH domain